jgi:adenylate kinase family enzyme
MVKISFIFLIGRPGSGKTTAYKLLRNLLQTKVLDIEIMNIDDFSIIQGILERDMRFMRHRRPADGGFEILDSTVYDDALKQINKRLSDMLNDLRNSDHKKLIFVQFARTYYIDAFRLFSPEVIAKSLLIYLNCSFEKCWERNLHRRNENNEENHYVPRDVMEHDYFNDDRPTLEKLGFGEIVVLNNDSDDEKDLEKQLRNRIIGRLGERKRRAKNPELERLWQLELFEQEVNADR